MILILCPLNRIACVPLTGDDAANKAMFRGLLKQISEDNLVSGDSNTRLIMFIATLSWRGDQLEES